MGGLSSFFKKATPWLAGAGAGALSQYTPLKNFSPIISGAAGALTAKNPLSGFAAGMGGGALGAGLQGALTNPGTSGNWMDKAWAGGKEGFNSYMGKLPGMAGYKTSNPTGSMAKMFSPSYSVAGKGSMASFGQPGMAYSGGTPGMFSGMSTAGGGYGPGATGGVAGSMNPIDMFKSMVPGMLTSGIGSALVSTPEAPDYSGIQADFQKRIEGSANPEASKFYSGTLAAPTGQNAEAAIANSKLINDRQRKEALRALDQQFQANLGGADFKNSSEYQTAYSKLMSEYDQNYGAQAAENQFKYDQWQQSSKMAAANALQGMSSEQMQYYAGLAGLSVEQLMNQFYLDAGKAQSLKDLAATAGQLMMEKGLGVGSVGGVRLVDGGRGLNTTKVLA